MQKAADPHSPHVLSFCQEVLPGANPVRVACAPDPLAAMNDCFHTVAARVQAAGGQCLTGWAVWEAPGLLIEAEFHAVWSSPPYGELVDIARRFPVFDEITFIADPTRQYLGRQVNNVRKPLTKDPRVRQFIHFLNLRFDLLNAGSRADLHALHLPPKDMKQLEVLERQIGRIGRQVFR